MSLTEAADFLAESEALYAVLANLADHEFSQKTQFKGWSVNDVLGHLHYWNRAVELARSDEAGFEQLVKQLMPALQSPGGMRAGEQQVVSQRGVTLRETWISYAREIAANWADVDPKARIAWVGPSMSARSAMTARQMETWAHGFELFDLLGIARQEADRLRNIVVLGVNTFGWSHQVHGLSLPDVMPALRLTAPSGEIWQYGDQQAGLIEGRAEDFAAVVTQSRALADTGLSVTGAVAQTWMDHAQCFAGPPETPPASGSRSRAQEGV